MRFAIPSGLVLIAMNCPGATQLELSCKALEPEVERINRLAKETVNREGRTLRLALAARTVELTSEPPFDEPFSGKHYKFCDRAEGFIFIELQKEELSTGLLINETTGAVLQGGDQVILSPDRRAYFASEQPNGQDGANWTIRSVSGRESWAGNSFIRRPDNPNAKLVELDLAEWTANGEFSARASCATDWKVTWRVKLVRPTGSQDWQWLPMKRCR